MLILGGFGIFTVQWRSLKVVWPDEVWSQHNLDTTGPVRAMPGRQDPLVRDESSSTEPGLVNEQSRHPGILVGGRLLSSNNPLTGPGQSTVSWGFITNIKKSRERETLPAKLFVPFLYPGYLSPADSSPSSIFSSRASSGVQPVLSAQGETVGYLGLYLLQSWPFWLEAGREQTWIL